MFYGCKGKQEKQGIEMDKDGPLWQGIHSGS
jgi:hypothetical protein